MNRRPGIPALSAAAALTILVASIPTRAVADDGGALSIPEFLATKKLWSNYISISKVIVLEGRVGAYSDKLVRLRNCPIRLVPVEGKSFPATLKETTNVTVVGTLRKYETGYEVVVTSLSSRPTDEQVLRAMQRDLPADDPKPWHRVAEWGRQRAEFYKDDALFKAARKALLRAIQIERAELSATDIVGRLELAARITRLKLPLGTAEELRHEAIRLRWSKHLTDDDPTYAKLVSEVKQTFNGSDTPLKSWPAKLAEQYAADPIESYRKSNAEQRTKLHRVLMVEIARREIERHAKVDGSNGNVIASQLQRDCPELHALAESYRQLALKYRLANLTKAPRSEMIALAEHFKRQKDTKRATRIYQDWLTAQLKSADDATAAHLVQLADDYLEFLGDKPQAIALLKRAAEKDPGFQEVGKRMKRFGYVQQDGQWILQSQVKKKKPVTSLTRAIRQGKVIAGMTADDVRRATVASPDRIIRMVAGRNISEIWVYRYPDGTSLSVRFVRRRSESRDTAKVTAVSRTR